MRLLLALALCGTPLASAATAPTLTLGFTGVVKDIASYGGGPFRYPFNAAPGTAVSGTLTVNTSIFTCNTAFFTELCYLPNGFVPNAADFSGTLRVGGGPVIALTRSTATVPQCCGFTFKDEFTKGQGGVDGIAIAFNTQDTTFGALTLDLSFYAKRLLVSSLINSLASMLPVNFQGTSETLSSFGFDPTLEFTLTSLTPAAAPPFGNVDTPADNTTGAAGAVGVTGWALANTGVQKVELWREPVAGEATASNGLVFLVTTTMVPGARPDVAAAHPGYPNNTSGWGAQILTNQLPNSNGASGLGNGTYKVHALATDTAAEITDLGTKTFTADNAHSTLPFGTIDTPAQGGTASGTAFVNFGWALTPNTSAVIPKDGSSIWVFIDNLPVGHPVYDNFRQDIATLFPGLQNSNGAVGYYRIDTTKLTNGLHSISWSVTDSAGKAQGIGSRLFTVQN